MTSALTLFLARLRVRLGPITSPIMADPTDLNLDAPSDLQDIPELAMQLIPPPEGTYPDK